MGLIATPLWRCASTLQGRRRSCPLSRYVTLQPHILERIASAPVVVDALLAADRGEDAPTVK
jgi:hypothetical protein